MYSLRPKLLHFALITIVLFIVTSCQSVLTPRILLWHTWDGAQGDIINGVVSRFGEIFDDVVIVSSYVPADEIVKRYQVAAKQGLGPDIFIAPNTAVKDLADANLISPLPDNAINRELYYTASLATATYNNQLYGVPFSMRPLALYYNTDLVDTPATTLIELLAQAEDGTSVAINTQFEQILWGVQAYGGQILGNDEQVILNQGAFTNWLNWLLSANANPQMFLSRDATALRQLFTNERVAYYTGTASELTDIRNQMEEGQVGVIPLPAGPNGASGPLMQSDLLLFNPASVVQNHTLELAIFLTNIEQANTFLRELQIVPTNRRVRVDLRTYPAIAGFIAQTRTAITLPYLPQVTRLLEVGDDTVLRVLEGIIAPNTAADELTRRINSEFGLQTDEPIITCDLSGDLLLWHSLTNSARNYLSNLTTRLSVDCPDFNINTRFVPSNDIVSAYIEVLSQDNAPDILLSSTSNLEALLIANAITPISRDRMQAFSPIAQGTVTVGGQPYGIPLALDGNVFYYNRDVINDAPITINELLVETSPPFTLSRNADSMLWTLTAFNGVTVVENEIIVNENNLITWITWLRQVRDSEHITIASNDFLRESDFVQNESIYYVDSNLALSNLSQEMGESLGVARFPTGTSQIASPLVRSLAIFLNPSSGNREIALGFAELITDDEEQEVMASTLSWVPTNTTANEFLSADGNLELATITAVLQTGISINVDSDQLLTMVSQTIDRALRTDLPAETIAQDMIIALSEGETNDS